ncbi:NADPH:quinone oxidoreductase family protein [Actibacterium sp. 188UL27-1]|uniref:NADPH:quinone oxidoreductase family protein n=1 Tax=Actibacterium sp. 188UL27-1 TaxID=2786961 RepID=UPI0019561738|nr:NADPH:quinone oxidoreductase family protein [Actibacterium sp. 188UL27-1]MBM7066676.1 NADPH:quinone oxidoreductase family protein [Actibacterium sp. 188UL27-1]
MRAFQLEDVTRPPMLHDIGDISPNAGEVKVKIEACGLNFADLLTMRGKYQERPALPFTMGMEVAGTVIAQGADVTAPHIGDRVAIYSGQGGLAEQGCFAADQCLTLPESMPFTDAAAFQIAYGTSHLALADRAALQAGERLVVTGAAGGVGLTAVEIGALMGAEVIAVARGEEKLQIARAAGAHHLIDAQSTDIRGQIKALGGADVVYEAVGDPLFTECFRATNPLGRILAIGFAGGTVPPIAANHMLVKNISVIGFYWGGYNKFAPALLTGSLKTLLGWYADGKLRPHISHILPLERVEEGLELLRSRQATGKVVVTPQPQT